jgi:hypothetical protein
VLPGWFGYGDPTVALPRSTKRSRTRRTHGSDGVLVHAGIWCDVKVVLGGTRDVPRHAAALRATKRDVRMRCRRRQRG